MTKYSPVPKQSKFPPYGYKVDPEHDFQFLPVPDELDALEEGYDLFKKGVPIRRVADWISAETGRKISHVGLFLRFKVMKEEINKKKYASWVESNRRKYEEQHSQTEATGEEA